MRETSFCVVTVNQDSCAVIRESGFALAVKMPELNADRLFRFDIGQPIIVVIEGKPCARSQ